MTFCVMILFLRRFYSSKHKNCDQIIWMGRFTFFLSPFTRRTNRNFTVAFVQNNLSRSLRKKLSEEISHADRIGAHYFGI